MSAITGQMPRKEINMDTDSMILEILGDFPECDYPEEDE